MNKLYMIFSYCTCHQCDDIEFGDADNYIEHDMYNMNKVAYNNSIKLEVVEKQEKLSEVDNKTKSSNKKTLNFIRRRIKSKQIKK